MTSPRRPRVAIIGAAGRMGRALLRCMAEGGDWRMGAAVLRSGHPWVGTRLSEQGFTEWDGTLFNDDIASGVARSDVVIDFSSPRVTSEVAQAAVAAGIPLVTGTTGLREEDRQALAEASRMIAVIEAPNMSVGVAVLRALTRLAAEQLGGGWDAELLELHHRGKKDSPSGTATGLLQVLAEARGQAAGAVETHRGRGLTGPRSDDEIGVAALRGGTVPGEHTVFFFGADERIELTHRAQDRSIFARGALRAARWILNAPPGLYTMDDVLRMRG